MTPNEVLTARKALGLTQQGMAGALGLSGSDSATVRSWESGRRQPSGPVCAAIGLLLEIKQLRETRRPNTG